MKSNIKKIIIIYILLFIFLFMIINSSIVMKSVISAIDIWKNSVFPALFPFFIISDLLINYNFIDYLGILLLKPMKFIFGFNKSSLFIFFMSMLTGFPSSSKYIVKLLENNVIDIDTANRMITCSHFSNPLFIFGTIRTIINNTTSCIIIIVSHYLGNIIIAWATKHKIKYKDESNIKIKKQSFSDCLSSSIVNNTNTLLFILGSIIIFLIITSIFDAYLGNNTIISVLISGLFEITQGINKINLLPLSISFKTMLITMFISFGGLCIHIQTIGIISNSSIRYNNFFKARLLHCLISGFSAYIISLLF